MRIGIWLARHPTLGVTLLLVTLGVLTALVASQFGTSGGPTPSTGLEATIAPQTLPKPTMRPPESQVARAHQALHDLGAACLLPKTLRRTQHLQAATEALVAFARRYPGWGFPMDGESGSTPALVVVVWNELENCEPSLVHEVAPLLPAHFRGD